MMDIDKLILANQISIMQTLYDNVVPTVYKNTDNELWIGIQQSKKALAAIDTNHQN